MLTVLCIPLSALGHINPCVGICTALKRKGHKIVFASDVSCKGKFIKLGFQEVLYEERDVNNNEESNKFWSKFIATQSSYFRKSDKEKFYSRQISYSNFINIAKSSNKQIANIITTVCPDVIIQDTYVVYPSVVNSGIPFVLLFSSNPLQWIESDRLPAGCFGLPLNDTSEWNECQEIKEQCLGKLWEEFNEWVIANKTPPLKKLHFQHLSPLLNIYLYPKSLFEDYAKKANLGDKYILIQHTVLEQNEKFKLPTSFAVKPGKIIYLSLGSMASSDTNLMRRLISILSKSRHKVIVSTGDKHNEYKLADNMWGQPTLPQLKILEICDIFLTHAGNNSFTEALYFGKPMIAMPLFADQNDNAQRLVETKLGARINPFTVSQEQMLSTIDSIIEDSALKCRLNAIANEVRNCKGMETVVNRIEEIVANNNRISVKEIQNCE